MSSVRFSLALAALTMIAAVVSNAGAQCARWLPGSESPLINNRVNCAESWDPDGAGPSRPWLVFGGAFTIVGNRTVNRLAAWDGKQWRDLGSPDGEVRALAVFNGELIVGGAFSTIGGISASRIAKFDGTAWTALSSSVNLLPSTSQLSVVTSLLVHDQSLIVSGSFTNVAPIAAMNVAKWDGTTWTALGSGITNSGGVNTLCSWNGEIIAGGTTSLPVRRWTGVDWQPLGMGLNAVPLSLGVYDGELHAGGAFSISGTPTPLAKLVGVQWQPIAGLWSPLSVPNTASISTLQVYGEELFVGGRIGAAGTTIANGIASWNGLSFQTIQGGFASGASVLDMTVHEGELVAAGDFDKSYLGASTVRLARLTADGWRPFVPAFDPHINAMTVFENNVYAAGRFTAAGGVPAEKIARWDGRAWYPLGQGISTPGVSPSFSEVNCLQPHDGRLYVGGQFSVAGNFAAGNIASWDGGQWSAVGDGLNGTVFALASYDGSLIAAGNFNASSASYLSGRIARLNGNVWEPLGNLMQSFSSSGGVVLTVHEGRLYYFNGGLGFAYDGSTWTSVFSASGIAVESAVSHNGRLYIGGQFTSVGTPGFQNIARYEGGTIWSDVFGGFGGSSSLTTQILSLASYNGKLYAGGQFASAGGLPASRIAVLDGTNWRALGSGANEPIFAMTQFAGELLFGGFFTATNDVFATYFSRYTSDGVPAAIANDQSQVIDEGATLVLDATVLPGYEQGLSLSWRRNGTSLIDGLRPGGGSITGTGTSRLTITNIRPEDIGVFSFRAANACGERVLPVATIGVNAVCRADYDGSGSVTPQDIFVFLNAWFSQAPGGDFNSDGSLTPQDIFDFLNAWFVGC